MSSTVTTSSTAMAPAGQSDETIPLGVFLVKSDCNGEKLLFRFPYTTVKSELGSSKSHNASGGTNSSKPSKYALLMPPKSGGAVGGGGALRGGGGAGGGAGGPEMDAEHGHLPTAGIDDPQTSHVGGPGGPGGAALLPSFAELISSSNQLTLDANDQDEISKVIGITDSTFSTLFGVLKSKLCGMKFELKVDNVRFVGHPSTLTAFGATEASAVLDVCFHVVFALKANAPADVVHCYHDLSKRIATALISEEARCGYFSKETKIMGRCHDEIATTLAIADRDGIAASKVLAEGNEASSGDASLPALPYSSILERSHLAKSLQTVFRQLLNDGLVQVRINSLVNIHFCLPQKVHRKLLMAPTVMTPLTPSSSSSSSATPSASITTTTSKLPLITPESINKCLCGLRPYHTFLLLVSTAELMDFLPPDVSSPVVCLVKMASPLKNLIELSADAGISLSQTFNVVAQLVYWGKATIIFPICETNLYVLHPNANTDLHSPLAAQFEARFGKANATNASSTAANAANSADANANGSVPADPVPVLNASADPLLPNGAASNDISDRPSLHYLLSAFSPGVSLSQLRSPMDTAEQAREWVQVLEWLLQKRLLMQLHTYVVFFPLGQGPKPYIHCNASTSNGSHHHHQQHPRRMSFTQVSTSRPPSSSTTTTGGGGDLAGDYCSTIASSSYHSESSLLGGSLSPSADQLFDYFGSNQSTVTAGSSASIFRAGGGGRVHTTSMSETGGGVGGGGSLNGSSKAGNGGGTELSQLESAEMILRESDLLLSPKEMTAVLAVCATKSFEDIRLFARLCPVYFDGHHHVEDMMHYENLRRSQILTLVEKFQELLLVYTYEDTTVDTLQPYNTL